MAGITHRYDVCCNCGVGQVVPGSVAEYHGECSKCFASDEILCRDCDFGFPRRGECPGCGKKWGDILVDIGIMEWLNSE